MKLQTQSKATGQTIACAIHCTVPRKMNIRRKDELKTSL